VWLYYQFNLSYRRCAGPFIEDLLAEPGITASREAIRLWCYMFGPQYAKRLKRRHQGYGDTFFLDEVFVKIQGKQHYLWRAVDQDGEVVDVFLQERRDGKAAKRFFKRLLPSHGGEPRKIVTDKLRSYGVAHRELTPETIHDTSQYANNRAELSHQPTRPPRFQRVKAPVKRELEDLVQRISQRVGRCLERQGLLERDAESTWLELDLAEDTDAMPQILGSSVSYRIAVGAQQGRKAFMIRTIRPLDRPDPGL
jgi:transposase-like protein